jgi:hypothetical protein
MNRTFRPQLLALEAREVPAAFSFQLADGTTGHGTFATPDGVNPAQGSQSLAVPDLTVTIGGVSYPVNPGATANYANGVLLGVVASGADAFELSLSGVEFNGSSAPVAYDAAGTAMTFSLSDGNSGAISFQIPWESVDATLSAQSLTLQDFNLNLAGRQFTMSDVIVDAAPTINFVSGRVVGVTFALGIPALGFPYSAVSMSQGVVAATLTGGGTVQGDANYLLANASSKPITNVGITFAAAAETYSYELSIKYGDKTYTIKAVIAGGSSAEVIRDTVLNALSNKLANSGLTVSKSGTTGIITQAPADKSFTFGHDALDDNKKPSVSGPSATITLAD